MPNGAKSIHKCSSRDSPNVDFYIWYVCRIYGEYETKYVTNTDEQHNFQSDHKHTVTRRLEFNVYTLAAKEQRHIAAPAFEFG